MNQRGKWYNRGKSVAVLFPIILLFATGICYANPVATPRYRWLTGFDEDRYILIISFIIVNLIFVFLLGAGVFFLFKRLAHPKEKPYGGILYQFEIMAYLALALITSIFLYGIIFFIPALRKAWKVYRERYGAPRGDLFGRRRKVVVAEALILLAPINLLLWLFQEDVFGRDCSFGWYFLTEYSRERNLIKWLDGPWIVIYVTLLFATIWLFIMLILIQTNVLLDRKIGEVISDGLFVFGYIFLGAFTAWLIVGIWFYFMAVFYSLRTIWKHFVIYGEEQNE